MTIQEGEIARLMREGQAAAKRGDRATARALLTQVIESDPNNEQAWMWLSGAVTDPEEQQVCLENVLVLNPGNLHARKGLDLLNRTTAALSPVSPTSEETPTPPETASAASAWTPGSSSGFDDFPPGFEPAAPVSSGLSGLDFAASSPPDAASSWDDRSGADKTSLLSGPAHYDEVPAQPMVGAQLIGQDDDRTHAASVEEPAWNFAPFDPLGQAEGSVQDAPSAVEHPGAFPFANPPGDNPAWQEAGGSGVSQFASITDDDLPAFLTGGATPAQPASLEDAPAAHESSAQVQPEVPHVEAAPWVEPTPSADAAPWAEPSHPVDSGPWADSSVQDIFAQADGPFGEAPAVLDPFAPQMGSPLPAPSDLPGYRSDEQAPAAAASQPWYLQGQGEGIAPPPDYSMHGTGTPNDAMMGTGYIGSGGETAAGLSAEQVPHINCPNCRQSVPETYLACPDCRFSFFVHCPNCHELVDTSTAVMGVKENCPYCSAEIDKMELGLVNGATPMMAAAPAAPKEDLLAWTGTVDEDDNKSHMSMQMRWVVDVLWLVAIAVVVWAFTQVPAWLHLTSLYG